MLELATIITCLFLNALLAGAEMAFVSASRPNIRQLARSGNKWAETLLRLRESPERTLAVVQIGIMLVASVAGAVGGASAEEWLSPLIAEYMGWAPGIADALAIGVVVLPLTYATVVLGELFPKSIALRNSLGLALYVTPALYLLDRWLGPIVGLLERSTNAMMRWCRPCRTHEESALADSESTAVELSGLSSQHRQYVLNLVDLERKGVTDVMLPWHQVVRVDVRMSWDEVEAVVISARHTRLPVTSHGGVVGVLNTKEFITVVREKSLNWQSLLRKAPELPSRLPLLQGLKFLQEQRMHLGIVYHDTNPVGIVTLEDILEEVVGDIYDEDDDDRLRLLTAQSKTRSFGKFSARDRLFFRRCP